MTKLLEEALRKVENLPPDEQDAVASAMLEFLAHQQAYQLSAEQRAEVRRRQNDPNQVLVSFDDAMKRISEFGSPK